MGDNADTQKVQDEVHDTISNKPFYRPRYGRGFNRKRDSFEPPTTKQFPSGNNGAYEHGPEAQRGPWRPPIPGRGRGGFSRGGSARAGANPNEQSSPFMSSPPPFPFPGRLPYFPGGHNVGMMSSWGYSGISPVGIGIGNGLFLEQFRYPGHQQTYMAPKFDSASTTTTNAADNNHKDTKDDHTRSETAETQSEESYNGPLIVSSSRSASASSVKKKTTFALRGDAPEFIPLALRKTSSRDPTPASSPRPKAADSWAQVEMWREKYDNSGRLEGY